MYMKDFSLVNPFRVYDVGLFKIDFVHNISQSAVSRPKAEIRKEIDELFEKCIMAFEKLDVGFMENVINDKSQSGFIFNGKYYASSGMFLAAYRSEIKGIKAQQMKIQDKKITVLEDNSVLLTADGELTSTKQSGEINKGKFAWTIIYEKIDNEWKVIHANVSNQK